jgi:predicted TIM-barrel fold metal-dependent hydrolase
MPETARIIDADSHVTEPADLWERYIDPRFKDRAPSPRAMPPPGRPGAANSAFGEPLWNGERIHDRVSDELQVRGAIHLHTHYRESALAGFDAASHVRSLRRAGFTSTFLYPTVGLWVFAIDSMEADLAGAVVRAYNDWLYDFCAHDRAFLNGVGALSQHDPRTMVDELRRVHGFGWKAVFVRPNPIKGRLLSHPDYEPFWTECERLGVAVSVHEGTHARVPTTGADRFHTRFAMHACSHPMEHMMAFLALVEGGVLERHPALRVAFLEAGCGWVPYWLFRLDEEHKSLSWEVKKNVRLPPSEYFRRQCFVGVEPGEPYVDRLLDFIGEDNLLFGSDYPHIDHTPGALAELFRENRSAGERLLGKILRDNPVRYYSLAK